MRKIKPIRELTPEHLQEYHDEMYGIGATVQTISKALYRADEESNPASFAIEVSFALAILAKNVDALCDALQETIVEMEVEK